IEVSSGGRLYDHGHVARCGEEIDNLAPVLSRSVWTTDSPSSCEDLCRWFVVAPWAQKRRAHGVGLESGSGWSAPLAKGASCQATIFDGFALELASRTAGIASHVCRRARPFRR